MKKRNHLDWISADKKKSGWQPEMNSSGLFGIRQKKCSFIRIMYWFIDIEVINTILNSIKSGKCDHIRSNFLKLSSLYLFICSCLCFALDS